jgi:hypothetical protein
VVLQQLGDELDLPHAQYRALGVWLAYKYVQDEWWPSKKNTWKIEQSW